MPAFCYVYSTKHRQAPSRGPWCDWNSAAANKKKQKHFHLSGLGKKDSWTSDSSASICWYVDNTYGHTDICKVASNRNRINHRSQHVICLIMSNTSHFLSVEKSTLWASRWCCWGMAPASTVADAEHLRSALKKWHNTSCFLGKRLKLNKCHQTKYTYLLMFWTYLIQPLSSNQIYTCRPVRDDI